MFTSDQLLAMVEPANPSEEGFKLLSPEELQSVCVNVECVRRISTSGYMLTNWRYYRFDSMDAKNKWKTFGNFHCFASYDKVGEAERDDGSKSEQHGEITGMTIASMTLRGSACSEEEFIKLLSLDVHSSVLTKNMLMDHLAYGMKLFREKDIDFDRVRITIPEGSEDVFSSAFPGVEVRGQTLLLEKEI